jgi:hypothetical protein
MKATVCRWQKLGVSITHRDRYEARLKGVTGPRIFHFPIPTPSACYYAKEGRSTAPLHLDLPQSNECMSTLYFWAIDDAVLSTESRSKHRLSLVMVAFVTVEHHFAADRGSLRLI